MKIHFVRSLLVAVFALSITACNLANVANPLQTTDLPALLPTTTLPSEPLVTETSISVIQATPTSNQVIVTVIKESLYIRRGPGTDYDVLGNFASGESAIALYRNAQSSWVYIPLSSNPSVYGWVSIQTEFTSVQGDVSSLDVKNVDPAVPSAIRNCTFHPMLIQPVNILLDPQFNSPSNTHNFPPGNYAAYDQSQEGHPKVATFTLVEGDKVDINTDGIGNTYYCP